MKLILEDSLSEQCPLPTPLKEKLGSVIFIAGLFLVSFVARAIFSPLMPEIEKDLGIGHREAGGFFLIISLGFLLVPFLVGWISSRYNHRRTLLVSVWLMTIALIPLGFVKDIWALKIFMFILGVGSGLHLPPAMATIAAEVQKSDWGKALSIHQSVGPLGLILTPLVAALLILFLPWRGVIIVWGAITLVMAVAYTLKGNVGVFPGRPLKFGLIKSVIALPGFWVMLFLMAMGIGGNIGIYTMLPLYFVTERGMDVSQANSLIGLSLVSGVLGVLVSGWIIDKFGQKTTMVMFMIIAAVCTILIGYTSGPVMLGLLFIQAGALASFMPAAFGALARIAPPSLRSITTSFGPPAAYLLGAGIVPVFIGFISDQYSFSAGISLVGCFMILGPVLLAFLKLGQYDNQEGC